MSSSAVVRALGAAAILAVAALGSAAPSQASGEYACWVKNVRTQAVTHELQSAVLAADPGDALKVHGVCGPFTASEDLTLIGPATVASSTCPDPAMSDRGILAWIDADARVVLKDMLLTRGGSTFYGGAIHNYGTLVLRGSTAVTDSIAEDGGGGIYNEGLLIMRNASRVSRNSLLFGPGGGIWNAGTLVMADSSRVTANTAFPEGGGIYNSGTVIMRDWSAVKFNTAETGGGIYNDGVLKLKGASRIVRNTATGGTGGGIYSDGEVTFSRYWHGTVCWNTPDDWAGCLT